MEEEKYLKKQRIYKTIMLVVLTAFITCIGTTVYITNNYEVPLIGEQKETNIVIKSLEYIQTLVKKYYLNEIDEKMVMEGAISGYVSALNDPYTEYIPAEQMSEYTEDLMGSYVGVGIYMVNNIEKNVIEVLAPIKDSPAEEAGILPGDIILAVDGIEYSGKEMTAASNSIKGQDGTIVKIRIQRGTEILEFEMRRKKINTNPVISEKLENNIGYLLISSFDEGTSKDFKTKFEELKKQGIKSLIIDLRNNGGGLVDEALKIADYIVPVGKELLITVDKDKNEDIQKSKESVLIDMPIVVLVNKNTASASEILAGALKDNNEATIVGKTTYGKGVIQQLMTLKDGSGLKITVEEYFTPNRTKINGIGIEPNEKVELPETVVNPLAVEKEKDTQLKKAIELLK